MRRSHKYAQHMADAVDDLSTRLREAGDRESAASLRIEYAKQSFRRAGLDWPKLSEEELVESAARARDWADQSGVWAKHMERIREHGPQTIKLDGRTWIMGIDDRTGKPTLVDPESIAASIIMGEPSPSSPRADLTHP